MSEQCAIDVCVVLGGLYVQCFVRILPETLGKDEKFVTLKHNYASPQAAPQWKDKPTVQLFLCLKFMFNTIFL